MEIRNFTKGVYFVPPSPFLYVGKVHSIGARGHINLPSTSPVGRTVAAFYYEGE
ncbi:MAG: hypothetical protein OCU22_03085 [Canidatus Methanoxibalbensis ujae]|nr:hypothetical protein [Candidatus Methanoxibalbensis ujae]